MSWYYAQAASSGGGGGTSYQYYRLLRTISTDWVWSISELELFEATTAPALGTGTDLTTGGTCFQNGYQSGFPESNIIDGNTTSVWYSGSASPGWVGVNVGSLVAARSANVRTGELLAAGAIILQGSSDGVSYTDLASISSPASDTTYQLAW